MTVLDGLRAMRELLADKSRWTYQAYARNAQGGIEPATSPSACQWCLVGAAKRTFADQEERNQAILELSVRSIDFGGNLPPLNDHHGYEAVMSLLDRTILDLQSEAP